MNKTKQLPVLRSTRKFLALKTAADNLVNAFTKSIIPTMNRLGITDDEHIRKYLYSFSMEDLYLDAISENAEKIKVYESMYESLGRDYWAALRDRKCDVKSPQKEGFVFAQLPIARTTPVYRDSVLKAISVNDGVLQIDEKVLENECIIHPSEKDVELYHLIEEFCSKFEALNYKKRSLQSVITYKNGHLAPNFTGIVVGYTSVF